MRPPQFSLKALLWLTAGAAAFFGAVAHFWPHIRVTVENTGQSQICHLVFRVTGNSYSIGDLAPGDLKEAVVEPTGDSSLEIEFQDENGTKFRSAHEYFGPGYRATISVSIKDGIVDTRMQESRY